MANLSLAVALLGGGATAATAPESLGADAFRALVKALIKVFVATPK